MTNRGSLGSRGRQGRECVFDEIRRGSSGHLTRHQSDQNDVEAIHGSLRCLLTAAAPRSRSHGIGFRSLRARGSAMSVVEPDIIFVECLLVTREREREREGLGQFACEYMQKGR